MIQPRIRYHNIPLSKRFQVGDNIVLKSNVGPFEAYYSKYGENPTILFKEGMVGKVATNDTPVVRGYEGSWFYLVDFFCEETNRRQSINLYHHEIQKSS